LCLSRMSNRSDRSNGDGCDGPALQTLFVCLNFGLEDLTRAFCSQGRVVAGAIIERRLSLARGHAHVTSSRKGAECYRISALTSAACEMECTSTQLACQSGRALNSPSR
jgi:hypothetical protein